jgi:hypothetical protein
VTSALVERPDVLRGPMSALFRDGGFLGAARVPPVRRGPEAGGRGKLPLAVRYAVAARVRLADCAVIGAPLRDFTGLVDGIAASKPRVP